MAGTEVNKLKQYLLGQLTEAEDEQVELRLLSDPDFAEDFDILVDEITDDYISGKFGGEELQQVERYFFKSPKRRDKLKFALALKARKSELAADKGKRLWFMPYLAIAASLVIAVSAFYVWRVFFYQNDLNKGLVALRSAFSKERPLEARLADFTYAPLSNVRGGPAKVDYLQRDLAASLLLKEVSEHPSAASHHALGQYYLAERKVDQAIDQFKKALALAPNTAKIQSDFGAALLEKGKTYLPESPQGKAVQEFAESLTHLNKALELDGSNLEALFNRALVYDYLALAPQAAEDWRRYLQLDSNSKWADEARHNLKLVEEKQKKTSQSKEEIFQEFVRSYDADDRETAWLLVSSYHNRTGNLVVEQLLDAYLDYALNGRKDEAHRNLQMLSYVGEMEKERAGERFFFDLLEFYGSTNATQRKVLTQARALMKQSFNGWGQLKVDENLSLFSRAKKMFDEAGNFAESQVADYWIGFCHYRLHDHDQSQKILKPLVRACENNKYLWLQVRCLYLLSSVEFGLSEHSKALDFARQCVDLAERTNDRVGLLNAVSALIEYYRYLGNYPKALSYIQRGIPLVSSSSPDPIQATRHYGFAASAFATVGLYAAADGYQRESMRLASKTGASAAMTDSYAFLGSISGKQGHFDEALRSVRQALEIAQSQASDPASKSAMAYSLLQMGNIYREMGDFEEAIASFNRSIDLYENVNFSTHLYQAHKGRLLCYLAQKNDELAKAEITKTLGLADDYREHIKEENNRNTFFDVEQSVYDMAIDFEFSRLNNREQAFDYLSRARARSLLDLLKANSETFAQILEPEVVVHDVSQPFSLSQIRAELPDQTEIVHYAVLEDKLLIWVISRDAETVITKEMTRTELNEKVERYLELTSRANDDESQLELQLAKELFNILIRPVESLLDKEKQISIIPDKILEYLPFAALVSPTSGRYLVEDFTLLRSFSPSVFLVCTHAAARRAGARSERILSVGNPSFDRSAFPELTDLPSARSEAVKAATYYDPALSLTGGEAKAARVKDEMQRADVIHLALHSSLDDEVPLRSKLVLAKAANSESESFESSVIHAYEIYNLKLSQTRLVVLSACQTGAGRYYGGEGATSLARAFVAAGVPLVVASLWPVDSTATEQLMVNFHQHRKQKPIPTVEALGRAQRDMLRSSEPRYRRPYYWAAFTVIGGYATF